MRTARTVTIGGGGFSIGGGGGGSPSGGRVVLHPGGGLAHCMLGYQPPPCEQNEWQTRVKT